MALQALAAGLYVRSYSPLLGTGKEVWFTHKTLFLSLASSANRECLYAAASCGRCLGCSRTFTSAGNALQQQQPSSSSGIQTSHEQDKSPTASSTSSSSISSSRLGEVDKGGFTLVYEGFFSRPHRRLKVNTNKQCSLLRFVLLCHHGVKQHSLQLSSQINSTRLNIDSSQYCY